MGLYKKFRKYVTGRRLAWPVPFKEDRSTEEIFVRDPYVFLTEDGDYALTGTTYRLNYNDSYGVAMYKSRDKLVWSGPYMIVEKAKLNKEYSDFWAPEIHRIDNLYCLAVTLKPEDGKRGTYLFTSRSSCEGYVMRARITPCDKSSLDGTLYVENGRVWCVYCYEYTDCFDGEIRAVRLTEDMSAIEPETDRLLFKASANEYKPYRGRYKVTDGPFLFEDNGKLRMLWSTHTASGKYVQLLAYSDNGRLDGKWLQNGEPLYAGDGGHGMIFDDRDGKRYLVLHTPNVRKIITREYEHPVMLDIIKGADK